LGNVFAAVLKQQPNNMLFVKGSNGVKCQHHAVATLLQTPREKNLATAPHGSWYYHRAYHPQLKEALQYSKRLLQMNNGKINRDLNTETKASLSLQEIYKWFE
jgi:hypothetical protein